MAADYVPRLRARSMERRAGSREKAQKINIERRTPNIERRKRVGSGESRNQELGKLEYWSAGAGKKQTK